MIIAKIDANSKVSPRKKMAAGAYKRFGTTAKNPNATGKGSLPVMKVKNQTQGPKTY